MKVIFIVVASFPRARDSLEELGRRRRAEEAELYSVAFSTILYICIEEYNPYMDPLFNFHPEEFPNCLRIVVFFSSGYILYLIVIHLGSVLNHAVDGFNLCTRDTPCVCI